MSYESYESYKSYGLPLVIWHWSLLVGFVITYLLDNSQSTPRIEYHESGRCCELRPGYPGYLDKCKGDQR